MVKSSVLDASVKAIAGIPIIPTLLEVICRTTGMGFAAVARVTSEKWITCAVRDEILFGLTPGDELILETTICNDIRQNHQLVVIDDVKNDEFFCTHPTPIMYGFESYISVPIIKKDGSFFGTLCAIDPRPARLKNPETIGMFTLFADLISFHLNAIEELSLSEARLLRERETAELREQFIAILGHDLRNPVGAVLLGAEFLLQSTLDQDIHTVANSIKNSSYRMKGLIENILDFARGRLGAGIVLHCEENTLHPLLNQIITELCIIYPDCNVETDFNLLKGVNCDANRIAQLFSNLLNNAIIHGEAGTPVLVNAFSNDDEFRLSVTNYGNPISSGKIGRLFQPFYRGEDKSGKSGLGLGLYISSEIAKAHSGVIKVISNSELTCFTVSIPQKI